MAGKPFIANIPPVPSVLGEMDREKYLDEMFQTAKVVGRIIEKAMSQTGSYKYSHKAVYEERFKKRFLDFLVFIEFPDNQVT